MRTDHLSWIDPVADRFEQAWQEGPRPRIEHYLSDTPEPRRAALLDELLAVELHHRRRLGEAPALTEYLRRFPGYDDLLRAAFGRTGSPAPAAGHVPVEATLGLPAEPGRDTPAGLSPRYTLTRVHAEGGLGRVWVARDGDLNREVALKEIRPRHAGHAEAGRRFLREAQVTGQLEHPNIVPVYELGRGPDGQPFYTMRFVRGRTLHDAAAEYHQRRGQGRADPPELPRLLNAFVSVCNALSYAHARGVVHRDLKPDNVLLGEFGEVLVLDWGLAKIVGREDAAGGPSGVTVTDPAPAGATVAGVILGTYAYMPPEQARGEVDRLDERADVFGLGAILCEILTGQPPYAGPGRGDVVSQAEAGDVSGAFARLDGCGADPELIGLAKACLAPEPHDRPDNAGDVAARLTAHLDGVQERLQAERLARERAQVQAAEERKRRRLAVGLALAVFALAGLGGGGWLWLKSRAEQLRRDVAAALERAEDARRQGDWPTARAELDRATGRLGTSGPDDLRLRLQRARGELDLVTELEEVRLQRSNRIGYGDYHYDLALRGYAKVFAGLGLTVEAGDEAQVAEQLRTLAVSGPVAGALDDWALAAYRTQRHDLCDRLLRLSRQLDPDPRLRDRLRDRSLWDDRAALERLARDAAGADLPPQLLGVLADLFQGVGADARPLLRAAWEKHPGDFWVNALSGEVLLGKGEADEAKSFFRAAVALRPRRAAPLCRLASIPELKQDWDGAIILYRRAAEVEPDYAPTHINLGLMLRRKGDPGGAIAAQRQAIRLVPDNPVPHANLGLALGATGDHIGAIAAYREALRLSPDFADVYAHLADELHVTGDLDGAHAACQKAFTFRFRSTYEYVAYNTLGRVLDSRGDFRGAVAAYRNAIRLKNDYLNGHFGLAFSLAEIGEAEEADTVSRTALRLHPNDPRAHGGGGEVLLKLGRFQEAAVSTQKALDGLPAGHRFRRIAEQQLRACRRRLAAEAELESVLAGRQPPADPELLLGLAELCQFHRRRPADAARFYTEAFAAAPQLPADPRDAFRLAAARAALAATRAGQGADQPAEADQARLRSQALVWLRAELAAWAGLVEKGPQETRWEARLKLAEWTFEPDLAAVREAAALAKLPDADRPAWQHFWADVAAQHARLGLEK
jgi:serine/threonine-protein kinase